MYTTVDNIICGSRSVFPVVSLDISPPGDRMKSIINTNEEVDVHGEIYQKMYISINNTVGT
jgi:hypothetical protein